MNAGTQYALRDLARIRANVARSDANSLSAILARVEPRAGAVRLLYVAKRRRDARRARIVHALRLVALSVVLAALVLLPAALFIVATNH